METAVIFMLCIFLFCFILSTTSLISHNRVKIENTKIDNDINIDLMIEDYLAYIETVYVASPAPPAQETTAANAETTQVNSTETTAPPQENELNVPVDIMPEIPILSPIAEVSETETEIAENTTSPIGVVTPPADPTFEDYVNDPKKRKANYEGYSVYSQITPGDGSKMFTLTVSNSGGVCVLSLQVFKLVNAMGEQQIIIQSVNKSP